MSSNEKARVTLGMRLRRLRKNARLTGTEIAERIGISQSKLSKIEQGKLRPTMDDIQAFALALNLGGDEKDLLADEARRLLSGYRGWDIRRSDWSANEQEDLASQESAATEQRLFQDTLVPGLLQTRDYARSVLKCFSRDLSRLDVDSAVEVRVRRQRILDDLNRRFWFINSESALHTRVASNGIMLSQLKYLKEVARRENVRIGIVPLAARISTIPMTNFVIFDDSLVSIETFAGEVVMSDSREVGRYIDVFEQIRRRALFGEEFLRLVEMIARNHRASKRS